MEEQQIAYLIRQLIARELSAVETEELERFLGDPANEDAFTRAATHLVTVGVNARPYDDALAGILAKVIAVDKLPTADLKSGAGDLPESPAINRIRFLKTAWFRYAAILLLLAGTATVLYMINQTPKEIASQHLTGKPGSIQPGGNRAILILADGRTIGLDSSANGMLAEQGETKIIKLDAGSLAYSAGISTRKIGINTIRTPKGGQYQITLPDGTKVWLNAASAITFPTAFEANRTVEITGESFFEVAANKNKAFFVKTGTTTIQVLGTSFNINAYLNEQGTRTTLVTGRIQVISGAEKALLEPGQQALTAPASPLQVVNADISSVTAWKHGLFNFEGVGVEELMRQVERWYDVKVVYQSSIPKVKFAGALKRSVPLADLLEALEKTGVRNKLEANRTITIFP